MYEPHRVAIALQAILDSDSEVANEHAFERQRILSHRRIATILGALENSGLDKVIQFSRRFLPQT